MPSKKSAALPHDSSSSYFFLANNADRQVIDALHLLSLHLHFLLEQNLLITRGAIINWLPLKVDRTMDEGGWGLAYAIYKNIIKINIIK